MSVSEFCSAVLIVQTLVVCLISVHVKVKRPIRIFPHLHCRLKYYNLSKQVFTLKKVKSSAICLRKSKDEIKKKVCLWNNFAPSVTYIWPHLFGTIRYCTVNYIILLGQLYSLTWQWLAVCSHCLLGKGKKTQQLLCSTRICLPTAEQWFVRHIKSFWQDQSSEIPLIEE